MRFALCAIANVRNVVRVREDAPLAASHSIDSSNFMASTKLMPGGQQRIERNDRADHSHQSHP
jgi:hypothetical protein